MNTEEFGLSREVLGKIRRVFLSHKGIERVTLIGSRAKGSYQKGSDIDLVVWGTELNFSDYLKLISDLEELDIPYNIDLLKYELLTDEALKDHIKKIGREIYIKEGSFIKE